MSNLKEIATEDLKKELARREEVARLERVRIDRERREFIYKNIDVFLGLTPDHSRSSCSDTNQINERRGCNRCALLTAEHSPSVQDEAVQFDIQISIEWSPGRGYE